MYVIWYSERRERGGEEEERVGEMYILWFSLSYICVSNVDILPVIYYLRWDALCFGCTFRTVCLWNVPILHDPR